MEYITLLFWSGTYYNTVTLDTFTKSDTMFWVQ